MQGRDGFRGGRVDFFVLYPKMLRIIKVYPNSWRPAEERADELMFAFDEADAAQPDRRVCWPAGAARAHPPARAMKALYEGSLGKT